MKKHTLKPYAFTCLLLILSQTLYAQIEIVPPPATSVSQKLPTVHVHEDVSTHFISPEPIRKVDLSTERVAGDLLLENVLRIKPLPGSGDSTSYLGVLTIVGQKFMIQYELIYVAATKADKRIAVSSQEGISLLSPTVSLSAPEMKNFSVKVLQQKRGMHHVKARENRLEISVNNVFTVGDYFFIDLSARNKTNIPYSIDQLRFKIEDKKITKATNAQAVEIQPVYALYDTKEFKRRYRNVFVFEKFTFPNEKVFSIELAEKQISGRQVVLRLAYQDILNADNL